MLITNKKQMRAALRVFETNPFMEYSSQNNTSSSPRLHLASKCCFHNRTQAKPRFVSAASGFKTLTASLA